MATPWLKICGRMWVGETIQTACQQLGLSYDQVNRELRVEPQIRQLLVDTSMLASARDKILEERDVVQP